MSEVTFDDGHTTQVSRLPIFTLDKLESNILGPYTYEVELLTGKERVVYDGSRWKEPPSPPENTNPEEGSDDWYSLREYHLYRGWLEHERKREQSMYDYVNRCAWHILLNCIDEEDINHIVSARDWEKVHTAALVPEVQPEDIATVLRQTFPSNLPGIGDIRGAGTGEGG